MENIAAYIIIFLIGLGLLYGYQARKSSKRETPFSVQIYPECILKIMVVKQHGKIQTIIFRIVARKDFKIKQIKTELIDKDRNFTYLYFNKQNNNVEAVDEVKKNHFYDTEIPFNEFKAGLDEQEKSFQGFRFVVENSSGQVFKTHELTFNKNWNIYKPDSGKYN